MPFDDQQDCVLLAVGHMEADHSNAQKPGGVIWILRALNTGSQQGKVMCLPRPPTPREGVSAASEAQTQGREKEEKKASTGW